VLKGALLFQLWTSEPYRPTRDLDLLGQGEGSADRYRKIFTELCSQEVENDGLTFLPDTIRVERIRDEEEYEGVRALPTAHLAEAGPLQYRRGVAWKGNRSRFPSRCGLLRNLRSSGKSSQAPEGQLRQPRGQKPRKRKSLALASTFSRVAGSGSMRAISTAPIIVEKIAKNARSRSAVRRPGINGIIRFL
jgi:hypothetical protein